jgi:hypothetical protein
MNDFPIHNLGKKATFMNTVGDLINLFKFIFQLIQDLFGFIQKSQDQPAE